MGTRTRMMNPYTVLGLAETASKDDAKAAYRKLAAKYHPDRAGGDEEKFKAIKAAWEKIEAGWKPEPPEPPPVRSSFSDPKPFRPQPPSKPKYDTVGKAAPGFEARGTRPAYPSARRTGSAYSREYEVDLVITQRQADVGCNVPFTCGGSLLTHWVQAGSRAYRTQCVFPRDDVIGQGQVGDVVTVWVNLRIQG